jgi:protein SSD1
MRMEVNSRSVNDESALFDDDDGDDEQIVVHRTGGAQNEKESSKQRLLSLAKVRPQFEGLRITAAGHRIQEIKELMSVPVSGLVTEPASFLIYPT